MQTLLQRRLPRGRRPRARARSRQGLTLIEIMVVVAIIAVVGGSAAVLVFAVFKGVQVDAAEADAKTIRTAASLYILDGNGCPTTDDLIAADKLDQDQRTTDSWDNSYDIECRGSNIIVTSPGPDGNYETDDDISTRKQTEG